jgi:hypothetical protein
MYQEFQNLPPTSPGYEITYEEQCMFNAHNAVDRLSCSGDSTILLITVGIITALALEYLFLHKRRKKLKKHMHHIK